MGYRVPDETHHELQNWARWCWLGEWPCEAASEAGWMGGYQASVDDDDEPHSPTPVNERHALIVQEAWAGLSDDTTRKVLRAEYPARDGAGRPAAATRLGLTLGRYEQLLSDGVLRVEGALHAVCA